MAAEALLTVHFEVALAVVDDDLVVHGLACKVLHVWMHGCCGYCVHIWLADVLGHDRNAKLPNIHLLVICRGNEAPSILDECDRIN